jgi:rhamnogalacturonan endolyase
VLTANDDKAANITPSFVVSVPVRVYVAYDTRITPIPTWLSSWVNTARVLVDNAPVQRKLYSRDFDAGSTVTLGPNQGGNNGMYSVVLVPR